MASLTSFYQIKEVNTDMKTAQRDLFKEEEKNFDKISLYLFLPHGMVRHALLTALQNLQI